MMAHGRHHEHITLLCDITDTRYHFLHVQHRKVDKVDVSRLKCIFDTFQARCKLKMCCFGLPLLPYVGIFDDICLTRRVSRLSAWTHHVCFARFNYLGFVGVSARSCRIAFLRCGWVWKKLVRRDLIDLMFSSLLFCLPVDRHAFILVKKHTCQNRLSEQQAPHVFHLVALLAFLAAVILARWTFCPVS